MMSLVEEGREQEAEALGKDVICITAKGKPLKPKTIGQQKYVEAIRKKYHHHGHRGPPAPARPTLRWRWRSRRSARRRSTASC